MEKIVLALNLTSDDEKYKYSFYKVADLYGCDCEFEINTNINEDVASLLNNEKEIIKNLKEFVEEEYFFEMDDDAKLINDYLDKKIDIENNIEYITIEVNDPNICNDAETFSIIKKYLDKNIEFFRDKKIIIQGIAKIEEEQLNISNEFFGNYDNIYYMIEGNSMPISKDDYYKTIQKLTGILNNVKEKGLSPLENLMYLYDFLRKRKYKEVENIEDDANKSRDITPVILGEYIVCGGYTELFEFFAKKLGFRTAKYYITGKKSSHVRNLIYVEDPKYDADGIYLSDVTWGYDKNDNNEYLYNYKFFMKTISEMKKYDQKKYESDEMFDITHEIIDDLKEYPYLDCFNMESIKNDLFGIVGNLSKLLKKDNQLDNIWLLSKGQLPTENIIPLFEEYLEKINKPIELDKFCELLYNVRKIQNQENPDLYPFSYDDFFKTVIESKVDDVVPIESIILSKILGDTFEITEFKNNIKKELDKFNFGEIKQKQKRISK